MTAWPAIDYGHTPYETAVLRGDVYGIRPDEKRAAKRPLRLAVIGCGGVAQAKWLPAIRYLQTRSEPLTLAGVVDPDANAREKVATIYDCSGLSVARRPARLCDDRPCAGPLFGRHPHRRRARSHRRRCRDARRETAVALGGGSRTLSASSPKSQGVLLAGVANKRFSPPYALAHALVQNGALKVPPTVFSGKFTLGYPYVDILEAGTVHLFDLALWLMGAGASVRAIGTFGPGGKLESAVANILFRSGSIGSIVTSAAAMSFKPWERVEIIGRNAMLCVEDQYELTLYDDETGPAKSWRPAIPNTLMLDESFGGYAGLLENVLDAVRGLAALQTTGRDAAAAVALVAAIHQSIRQGGAAVDLA